MRYKLFVLFYLQLKLIHLFIYSMINQKNTTFSNKNQQQNSRFVRILYLKEVTKPKKQYIEQNQHINDKKSIAYLSSLIQDERKVKFQRKQLQPYEADFQKSRKGNSVGLPRTSLRNHSASDYQNQYKLKILEKKNKQNTLLNIIGTEPENYPQQNVKIKNRKKYYFKYQQEIDEDKKSQMETQFMNFCKILKPKLGEVTFHYQTPKIKLPQPKQNEQKKLTPMTADKYEHRHHHQFNPYHHNLSLSRSKKFDKLQKLTNQKNIIHKRNFKEMNNFEWGKLANDTFVI